MTSVSEKVRFVAQALMEDTLYEDAAEEHKREYRINAGIALDAIERWNIGYRGDALYIGESMNGYRGLVNDEREDVPELTHTVLWRVIWSEGSEWQTYANIDDPNMRPVAELGDDGDPVRLEITVGSTTRIGAIIMARREFERLFRWSEPKPMVYRVLYPSGEDYVVEADRSSTPGTVGSSRDEHGSWSYVATVRASTKERARRSAIAMWIAAFPDKWRA